MVSEYLTNLELRNQVKKTAMVSIIPIFFILFYLIKFTSEIIVGLFTIFMISASFFISVLILSGCFQMFYISQLHCLAISLVYAFGAHNVFVFYNIWNQAESLVPEFTENIEMRLAYTFRRSKKSLELSEGTTVIGFLALGFTRINSIQSFSVYLAFVIALNTFLSLIYLPCLVILMEARRLEKLK